MIIDAHVHVEPAPLGEMSMAARATLDWMDHVGIDRCVIMSLSEARENSDLLTMIASEMAAHPGRFAAYARIDPWYGAQAETLLRHALTDLGFAGLKLHPASTLAHPADEPSLALIRLAASFGMPTMLHCADEPMCTPLEIEEAARRCPPKQPWSSVIWGATSIRTRPSRSPNGIPT